MFVKTLSLLDRTITEHPSVQSSVWYTSTKWKAGDAHACTSVCGIAAALISFDEIQDCVCSSASYSRRTVLRCVSLFRRKYHGLPPYIQVVYPPVSTGYRRRLRRLIDFKIINKYCKYTQKEDFLSLIIFQSVFFVGVILHVQLGTSKAHLFVRPIFFWPRND